MLGELLRASLCPHPQDLFFHYVFNNFLHAQVEVCVSTMLSSAPPADSSSDTPPENPVVKHVSWAPGSPSPLVFGELCSGGESWSLPEVQSLGKQTVLCKGGDWWSGDLGGSGYPGGTRKGSPGVMAPALLEVPSWVWPWPQGKAGAQAGRVALGLAVQAEWAQNR